MIPLKTGNQSGPAACGSPPRRLTWPQLRWLPARSRASGARSYHAPMSARLTLTMIVAVSTVLSAQSPRPRARDLGLVPGVLAPGPLNAITDVSGVRVGHTTLITGDHVRT